jgi:hypothetical protein
LPLGAVEGLLAGDFEDESRHRYTLCDQACSRLMHGRQKPAPGIVDRCNLPHVDFDFFA